MLRALCDYSSTPHSNPVTYTKSLSSLYKRGNGGTESLPDTQDHAAQGECRRERNPAKRPPAPPCAAAGLPSRPLGYAGGERLWGLAPHKLCGLITIPSNTGPHLHKWTRLLPVLQTQCELQLLAFAYNCSPLHGMLPLLLTIH